MTTIERIETPVEPVPRRGLPWVIVSVATVVALVIGFGVGFLVGDRSTSDPARDTADRVMLAWQTADPDDIADVYAPDAVFVFDGEQLAVGLDEVTDLVAVAVNDLGNTYELIGPVSSVTRSTGVVYISFLVEVTGSGHPFGAPIIGFYRVQNGLVTRHVVMDAEHY